jgi:hypothetical protein
VTKLAYERRRESGAALLVTVLILIALGFLGISTLAAVMGDQQVAGYQSRGRVALHAAEAGMAEVQSDLSGVGAPTIATGTLGDASLYPYGRPSYGPDTAIADPVQDLGAVGAQGMNLRIGGGGPRYQVQYWKLNVQGNAPGGSVARVEAAVGILRGN